MSFHSRAMHRLGAAVSTLVLAVFVVGLTATAAFAAVTCNAAGGATLVVTMDAPGDSATISMDGTGDITVAPSLDADCSAHVDADVTLIEVNGNTGNESVRSTTVEGRLSMMTTTSTSIWREEPVTH